MFRFGNLRSGGKSSRAGLVNPLHLPWRVTRSLDRRALRERLRIKGLSGATPSLDVEEFLLDRLSDARDLFALRGVRTDRDTLFRMMARSLAADAAANDNGASSAQLRSCAEEANLAPAALVAALR